LWVADFTQLTTWQGAAYIAVVADAYSRLCVGWYEPTTVELVLEALTTTAKVATARTNVGRILLSAVVLAARGRAL